MGSSPTVPASSTVPSMAETGNHPLRYMTGTSIAMPAARMVISLILS